jgi:2-keto-4-pentenoate hydratase/2-oxohepta-3-ene-1,7-dioic acid hydratase in catechol pathway
MKLCRFGEIGLEKPGVLVGDDSDPRHVRIDVSAAIPDYNEEFFATGGPARLKAWLATNSDSAPRVAPSVRIAPPIARPSKIICVGLNYREHAIETGSALPPEPMIFGKATTAMCGAFDDIVLPRGGEKTDWEVELAVVIGTRASYVTEHDSHKHIAGYCIMNDISERAFQKERGGQFIKGKSCDTFAPFGPFLLTADELPDLDRVKLQLSRNGIVAQDGSTADMIFKVPLLVSYISHFMTLLPGDVISTGTPSGVGAGMKPPQFLSHGDIIEYSVEGLGTCRNLVRTID